MERNMKEARGSKPKGSSQGKPKGKKMQEAKRRSEGEFRVVVSGERGLVGGFLSLSSPNPSYPHKNHLFYAILLITFDTQ